MKKKNELENNIISLDNYFDWIIKNKKRIDNIQKSKKWIIKNLKKRKQTKS